MKFLDALLLSSSSLWKRKVRTILTVLGVVVGTASIVVMISLGLGLNRATMADIEKYGGLTTITVHDPDEYGMPEAESDDKSKEEKNLDDELVENLKGMEHVKDVLPTLDTSVLAKCGSYEAQITLTGMPAGALEAQNVVLAKGNYPSKDAPQLEIFYGNMVLAQFSNPKTNAGYWYDGTVPDIDLMNDTMFFILDMDSYYKATQGTDDGTVVKMPKKYLFPASGLQEGGLEDYSNFSYNAYCDIDQLKKVLKKEFKNRAIPGQPTMASGKPYKEIFYNSIIVNVDNMDVMKDVQAEITAMGYQAESNAEWVEQMQSQYGYIQLILGGIGAVSLFVAAIGITNTMMMSIYERTKEIGIMKVLGCDIRNIQGLFLLEAGYIGLIGGILGVLLSYAISLIINSVVKTMDLGMATGLSYIPPWLALVSIVFAIVVGMVAGFFPSLRAMRLSPLAAIRNE